MVLLEFNELTQATLLIVGAVLPVVNPLAEAPIFLKMKHGCDEPARSYLANRIALYSFFLLLGLFLLGSFVLRIFGISIPVVQVAGGAIVCALSWSLLVDISKTTDVILDAVHAKTFALGRIITPLTLPMTIDELGISKKQIARPIQAAIASATSFAVGAAMPLLVTFLVPESHLILFVSGTSIIFLALVGCLAAQVGGAKIILGAMRVTFWGTLAMGTTTLIGTMFGVAV